jgi:hypothetical protein
MGKASSNLAGYRHMRFRIGPLKLQPKTKLLQNFSLVYANFPRIQQIALLTPVETDFEDYRPTAEFCGGKKGRGFQPMCRRPSTMLVREA